MAMPRVLYLGMAGPLSVEPLRWFIDNGYGPDQVAVPAHLLDSMSDGSRQLPVVRPLTTCARLARQNGLPVIGTTREWQERLAEHPAEVLLSACWPWRLPTPVLEAFPGGCYNLHPSLLPRFRGPAPLFWQLRHGCERTGVTLHRLGQGLDDGPIVAQRSLDIDDDDTEESLGAALGALSATVLAQWWSQLRHGAVTTRPQEPADSTYQCTPTDTDFRIPVRWTARRAYRFMHGTAVRGHPFEIDLGTARIRVRDAIALQPQRRMETPLEPTARGLLVRFAAGAVEVVPA